VNGFRVTGISPFEPNVFRDRDFAASITDVGSSLGVQEEHSTSFVMPTSPQFSTVKGPEHRERLLPAKVLLAW
jgi:hypothetical protein